MSPGMRSIIVKRREILERGEIGDLRMAFHAITSPYPGWSAQDWLGDEEKSGGPIVDLAIHSVDYMLWLFKSPVVRVYALGSLEDDWSQSLCTGQPAIR